MVAAFVHWEKTERDQTVTTYFSTLRSRTPTRSCSPKRKLRSKRLDSEVELQKLDPQLKTYRQRYHRILPFPFAIQMLFGCMNGPVLTGWGWANASAKGFDNCNKSSEALGAAGAIGSEANKSISEADAVLLDDDDELLKNGLTDDGGEFTLDWNTNTNQKNNFFVNIEQTLNWFMAASSSARAWSFRFSSMPLAGVSKRPLATTFPKALLVEDNADTPDLTFFWLLQ